MSSQGSNLISLFVSLKYSNKIFMSLFLVSTLLNFKSSLYKANTFKYSKKLLSRSLTYPYTISIQNIHFLVSTCFACA